jgi:O-antigen/teichoic acid export membrane protein
MDEAKMQGQQRSGPDHGGGLPGLTKKTLFSRNDAGVWSLADQGTVSLGNFLTNIFLARTLAPADYGIFALVYGLLVVLNSFHTCTVTYPLSIRGATSSPAGLRQYTLQSMVVTGLLAIPLATIILGATSFLHRSRVASWAILALLSWQLQETLRRGLMAHLRHGEVIWGDALSYLGQAALIFFCVRRGAISLQLVFGIIAATSFVAIVIQSRQLQLDFRWEKAFLKYSRESWELSRWAILANFAVAVSSLAFPWFLLFRGIREAASFQSLLNLVGVTNPVMLGVSNVLLPAITRAGIADGFEGAIRILRKYSFRGAMLLLPFYLVMAGWPRLVLRLFYGPASPYQEQALAFRLIVVAYAIIYLSCVLGALFYGLGRSKSVLQAQSVGAAIAVALGFPLVSHFGIPGASAALALVYLAQMAVFAWLIWKERAHPTPVGELHLVPTSAESTQDHRRK